MEVSIVVQFESSAPPRPSVESDVHPYNVLGFFEIVIDTASTASFDEITLARPARVRVEAVVSSVFGRASGGATTVTRRPLVKRGGFH